MILNCFQGAEISSPRLFPSVVRIVTVEHSAVNATFGTGFYVEPNLICTAAHNVVSNSIVVEGIVKGKVISQNGKVVFRSQDHDICFVLVSERCKQPFSFNAKSLESGKPVSFLGFGQALNEVSEFENGPVGIFGFIASSDFSITGLKCNVLAVQAFADNGYSGSPVYADRTEGVIGMIVKSLRSPEIGTIPIAFAVRASTLKFDLSIYKASLKESKTKDKKLREIKENASK